MADDAPQSAEEMAASLAEYKEQLAQVEALLAADPANAEFLDVKASLEEVIALTEDLVATAAAPPPSAPPPPPLPLPNRRLISRRSTPPSTARRARSDAAARRAGYGWTR